MKTLILILLTIGYALPNTQPTSNYTTAADYYATYVDQTPVSSVPTTYTLTSENNNDDGWDFEEDETLPEKPDGPMPIGNGLWILLALAAAYGIIRRSRVTR